MDRTFLLALLMAALSAGCSALPAGSPTLTIDSLAGGDPFAVADSADTATTSTAMLFYMAAATGNRALLEQHRAQLDAPDPQTGMTALHMAVMEQNLAAAQLLLAAGAQANSRLFGQGPTPLYDAVNLGQSAMVALLLEHGAQPDVRDAGSGLGLLHATALEGDTTITLQLIAAGADVNAADARGVTPLHLAVVGGNVSTIQALGEAGARADARSRNGHSPLDVALRHPDRVEVIDALRALEQRQSRRPAAARRD